MLSPNERHLYMEALKPPAGYSFDRGVATTFSLDLITLLVAPLSFALFECKEEKEFIANPIAVLEALRRAAGKLAVFCQRGRISIPSTGSLLYSYLERMVVEVIAPNENGVFHPKIWLLRYTADDHPVIYRLLCLSRNITFDRSWDILLVLEGEVSNKKHPGNHPLADFIRYLPELAGGRVLRRIRDDIELLANEVMQVAFTPPLDFDQDIRFWPIGLPGLKSFPLETSYNRLLIISPFLSEDMLTRFNNKAEKILISRVDSLDTIDGNILAGFQEVFIMDDLAAEPETTDEDNVGGSGDAPSPGEEYVEQKLTGLHAKLYLAENGRQTRLWTGSANATNAAFNHVNVEFLVELSGNKSKIGIDRFLGRDDSKDSFRNLLKQYHPPVDRTNDKTVEQQLEEKIERARTQLVRSKLFLTAVPSHKNDGYDLILTCMKGSLQNAIQEIEGVCWPITLKPTYSKPLKWLHTDEGKIVFDSLSPVAVTSFMAFELTAKSGDIKRKISFVLNLPLEGLPIDRDDRILQSIITDRSSFIQYILFLLAEGEMSGDLSELIRTMGRDRRGKNGNNSFDGIPLMEELVRALSRKPEKIDSIAKLVEDLRKHPDGEKLLPEEFDVIWQPVWNARKGMKQG